MVKQRDLMASLVQLDPPELTPAVTTASTYAKSAVSQNTVSGTLNMQDGRFQTCVKVPVPLPKLWEPVDTSLMLNPPTKVAAVPQVPDTEITKFPVWLEAFSARAAHASSLAATMLGAMYMMNLKVLAQLREAQPKSGVAA